MASCTTELQLEVTTPVDFSGEYFGTFDCNGELTEANGESMVIWISRSTGTNRYTVGMGEEEDDLVFDATANGNVLTIEQQTLNEEYQYDVITLSGTLVKNDDTTLLFEFTHDVDDEGESNCNVTLQKL